MKIKKFLRENKIAIIILSAIIIVSIIGLNFQSVLFPNSTGYSTVNFDKEKISYSNIISQTQSSGYLLSNNVFTQWSSGNVYNWVFYNNIEWLKYYINYGLKINSNDFTILPGDGNNVPLGCHLSPNYCSNKPTGQKVTVSGMDSNGCPLYTIQSAPITCKCFQYNRICNGPDSKATEIHSDLSQWGQWSDCSTWITLSSNVGGSISGSKNYVSILQSDGWSYDGTYNCWKKNSATNSIAEQITQEKICRVYGTFEDGTSYSYYGNMKWEGKDDGFNCQITDNFDSKKIREGFVNFYTQEKIIFYRFENNQCTELALYPSEKMGNDFSSRENCQKNIVVENITLKKEYYRYQNNLCFIVNIPPSEKTLDDYDTLQQCQFVLDIYNNGGESGKQNIFLLVLIVIIFIIVAVFLVVLYKKLNKK